MKNPEIILGIFFKHHIHADYNFFLFFFILPEFGSVPHFVGTVCSIPTVPTTASDNQVAGLKIILFFLIVEK